MNTNTFIPPGALSVIGREARGSGDARTDLADRFQNPVTLDKKIEKRNLTEDQKKDMLEEFKSMDKNNDGYLD